MTSSFYIFGPEKRPQDPRTIHVMIPYCLKNPDCPFERHTNECQSGCGLCDCEQIIQWAQSNDFHYAITRGSVFYETYFPQYKDSMELIITFSCLVDEMKTEVQKAINEYRFSLILIKTALSCRSEDVQGAKHGDADILNYVDDLENKLKNIEQYLFSESRKGVILKA